MPVNGGQFRGRWVVLTESCRSLIVALLGLARSGSGYGSSLLFIEIPSNCHTAGEGEQSPPRYPISTVLGNAISSAFMVAQRTREREGSGTVARIVRVTSVLIAQVAKPAMNARPCLWKVGSERSELVLLQSARGNQTRSPRFPLESRARLGRMMVQRDAGWMADADID